MMAQVRRDFQGHGNVGACSQAPGEAMREGVQLTLPVPRQILALRHVPV